MGNVTTKKTERPLWFFLVPALLGFLLYLMTLGHGFVLDDNLVITQNSHIQEGVSGIGELFTTNYAHGHQGFNDGLYRPLSLVTFAVEKSLFNLNPGVSHFIQALLYGIAVILLIFWLLTLFGRNSLWPFWIALLFALHPIHSEVVANLKSRDELLAFLFFAGAAWQFTKWLDRQETKHLAFAALWLLLALFSKESAVALVAVFPLLAWYRQKTRATIITAALAMAFPAVLFLLVRFAVLSGLGPVDSGVANLLQNSLMEMGGITERIATVARIQGLYLGNLTVPAFLSHDYSYNAIPVTGLGSTTSMFWLAVVLALLIFSLLNLGKRKWWAFGVLFYFITISVVANLFILIGAMAAERFLFTPSLGWCIALVALASHFKAKPVVQNVLLCTVGVSFLALSVWRIPDWESNYTLFTTDVDRVPGSARAHYNAGSAIIEEAKKNPAYAAKLHAEAQKHLRVALTIWPEYQDAYNNLGISYMNSRDYESAYNTYTEFIGKYPDYAKARYNMAVTSFNLKRYDAAEKHFEHFLRTSPGNTDALFLLAESEGFQNKFDEAITHLKQLISLEPRADRGYLKLGMAYAITGNTAEAESYVGQAIQLNPASAENHFNMGLIFLNTGRQQEAVAQFKQAVQIEPGHERASALLKQFGG